ncbi:MAG: hypothetical protein KIT13_09865 [Burkholderiales bacterium]|nr:hypothetical protein [Burkholderiales bacterium]
MLRHFLLTIAVIVAATACQPAGEPQTPSAALLHKVKQIRDAGALDYAAARAFLGVPLDTFRFAVIVNGDRITSRGGEYHLKKGRAYPPEFTTVRFDMAWEAESNRPSVLSWHREKGLKSMLGVSFDEQKICITRTLLEDAWGRGREGRFSHGDDLSISYGNQDKLLVSFTFRQQDCADSMDIIANDPRAHWTTPADVSAGDVEFVTKFLPFDGSGKQLMALGLECGPSGSAGSRPEDRGCVCPRAQQTRTGPCHHAVTWSPAKEGSLMLKVWPLLNPEAN